MCSLEQCSSFPQAGGYYKAGSTCTRRRKGLRKSAHQVVGVLPSPSPRPPSNTPAHMPSCLRHERDYVVMVARFDLKQKVSHDRLVVVKWRRGGVLLEQVGVSLVLRRTKVSLHPMCGVSTLLLPSALPTPSPDLSLSNVAHSSPFPNQSSPPRNHVTYQVTSDGTHRWNRVSMYDGVRVRVRVSLP